MTLYDYMQADLSNSIIKFGSDAVTFGMLITLFVLLIKFVLAIADKQTVKKAVQQLHGDKIGWTCFITFLFITYLFVVICLTLFSREPGTRGTVNLVLLSSLEGSADRISIAVENMVMLAPFGILMPLVMGWSRKWYFVILTGALLSLAIETVQLVTGCGYFELDDILFNTLGVVIGYVVWRIGLCIFTKIQF